ncbi:aminodeoxychorismate synthase, component I, partial [Sphingomonas sp. HMWF008]
VLSPGGAVAVEVAPMPPARDALSVAIVPLPVAPADIRLRHKTSDRRFYDAARHGAGVDEVLFARPDGRLTEGSFTSLFVPGTDDAGRDVLITPPLAAGLLPGVLRAELLESGRAIERDVTAADLTTDFFVGNALRGLIIARLAVAAMPRAR